MKKQAYNPYLPLNVCIPDGEPHVFGDRVYIFGSHDKEGGDKFCMLDYEVFSAPIDDLGAWESRGTIYRANQDPLYSEKYLYMYAPDVVRGNDGRYYLYYCLAGGSFTGPVHVAVCDTPAGQYEYHGEVRNTDGTRFWRNVTFDPAVINDNGSIRLYYGWALALDEQRRPEAFKEVFSEELIKVEMWMFEKTREEILLEKESLMGAFTVQLADDMLTVVSEPKRIIVGQFDSFGTEFEGHAFFEASSIRKIGDIYYFIYSSENEHELCYATSSYPDKDFKYGGAIISNGDIGINGRKAEERLAATGNNHGSIEKINDKWYVFYHRPTHRNLFSRQGCAEEILIDANGNIAQVEMTSCGLNGGPLSADGEYSSLICCNLTNGKMPHITSQEPVTDIPHITNNGDERFISEISNGTLIGYKYFEFSGMTNLEILERGDTGTLKIVVGSQIIKITLPDSKEWQTVRVAIAASGIYPLYMTYIGEGKIDIKSFTFLNGRN